VQVIGGWCERLGQGGFKAGGGMVADGACRGTEEGLREGRASGGEQCRQWLIKWHGCLWEGRAVEGGEEGDCF